MLSTRRLDDRRSPLQCARRTYMVDGFRCHIWRNPEHRMVFELFGWNERQNPIRQRTGVKNRRDGRRPHPIIKSQYDHPTPCPACTHIKKDFGLHRHVSLRRVPNDSKWVDMVDQPRKPENHKHTQVQQLVPNDGDQSIRGCERSGKYWPEPMAWHLSHMSQAGHDRQLMVVGYIPKLQVNTNFYEHCWYGKHTRIPHYLHYEVVMIWQDSNLWPHVTWVELLTIRLYVVIRKILFLFKFYYWKLMYIPYFFGTF